MNSIRKWLQQYRRNRQLERQYWRWMKTYESQLNKTGYGKLYDLNVAIYLYVSGCTISDALARTIERNTERRSIRRALGDSK